MKKINWMVLGISLLSASLGWAASSDSAEKPGSLVRRASRDSLGISAGAGAGAGSASGSTADHSAESTNISSATTTAVSEVVNPLEPLKPIDLRYEYLMDNMFGDDDGNILIKGYKIYWVDSFFSALRGVLPKTYEKLKGLNPYMPFSKWVIVTPENKDILEIPSDIKADGNNAVQFAYFFPKAFGVDAPPKKMVVSLNLNGATLPETMVQPYAPYKTELETLDGRFSTLLSVLNNPAAWKEDLKFFADYGIILFQNKYAFYCYKGIGGPQDLSESKKYFKLAADQGHMEAQFKYAEICIEGKGGPTDPEEGRKYLKLAADQGHMEVQFKYAEICIEGKGGPTDLEEGRKYLKLAADQGHMDALLNYAFMCEKGNGGPLDLEEARKYYKLAADQGNKLARMQFALMCLDGKGGPKDTEEALRYLR